MADADYLDGIVAAFAEYHPPATDAEAVQGRMESV
jgi:hypothetical protein